MKYYYKLRHPKTDEVTTVCTSDESSYGLTQVFFCPIGEGDAPPLMCFYGYEITKFEYETILVMHDIDPKDMKEEIDFWLFTGNDKILPDEA